VVGEEGDRSAGSIAKVAFGEVPEMAPLVVEQTVSGHERHRAGPKISNNVVREPADRAPTPIEDRFHPEHQNKPRLNGAT
jgi:hypothetical protein